MWQLFCGWVGGGWVLTSRGLLQVESVEQHSGFALARVVL